ncbi:Uma2 family endonuclease [Sorangium sp. So ce145]|uniref:Uma2 family endonuclease n=1 Tax=Sorangium sp. So ce145 TaxID=3133285 RepID=UPI003F6175BF
MRQALEHGYAFDPDDPRAPSEAAWERMTDEERARVVDMLPSEFELEPPEGDPHRVAAAQVIATLDAYFRRSGRRIYLSSNLAVFYPDEPAFAPDLLAVLDVAPGERMKWVVGAEGKGLDLVLEVAYAGNLTKDFETNVERYARLGISEYFIFDRRRLSLRAYRLPPADTARRTRSYQPVMPQAGRFASQVLGLELAVEGSKLRFFSGTAKLEEADELIARLGVMLDDALARKDEAELRAVDEASRAEEAELRAEAEAKRAESEAKRAESEAKRADAEARRASDLERQLAEALAEIERLRRN